MDDKIFLVEDDISICEMVSNYLVGEGFSVDIFNNGAAAVIISLAVLRYTFAKKITQID